MTPTSYTSGLVFLHFAVFGSSRPARTLRFRVGGPGKGVAIPVPGLSVPLLVWNF